MIYFRCKNKSCGFDQDYEEGLDPALCPECGSKCYEISWGKPRGMSMRQHELLSNAMACLPDEVPTMMKHYPDSEYVIQDGIAKLKVKNWHHKKKEMKRRGYAELD